MADKIRGERHADKPRAGSLLAAIDLGTNNCRLLVAEPRGASFRVVDTYSQLARLGEGLHATGRISEAASDRALAALQAIRKRLRQHRVGQVRCIATEACRKAENGAEFIVRIQRETGLSFRVIGPKEEARLAALGCLDLAPADAGAIGVVDIGGGSTEISILTRTDFAGRPIGQLARRLPLSHWASLKVGVVTLTEAFADRDETEAWPHMIEFARRAISAWPDLSAARSKLAVPGGTLIGTSGTVTCVAGVHLGLDRYRRDLVDGCWMNREAGAATIDRLRRLSVAERAELPTIGRERAGLMLAGCAIFEAVWEALGGVRMRVADRGLREGLLLTMMHGVRSRPRRRRRSGSAQDGRA